jgi:hypothetical protein
MIGSLRSPIAARAARSRAGFVTVATPCMSVA